jgi:twitching motility protein PilT
VLRAVVAQRLCKRASGEGRVAVLELLLQSHATANLIRENKIHQLEAQLQSGPTDGSGSQSFDQALLRFLQEDVIASDEALRLANYPEVLRRQIAEMAKEQ